MAPGGRVYSNIHRTPFEVWFGAWRLSWVSFSLFVVLTIISLGILNVSLIGGAIAGSVSFLLLSAFVIIANTLDPDGSLSEVTTVTYALRAWVTRPKL